jgi:cell division septum initiation protein DivIVA
MSNLEEENKKLKKELKELKERLKKYTAPERGLNYYHKNKEKISEYKKEYYQKQKAEKEKNKIG